MVATCNLRSEEELDVVAKSVSITEDNYMIYCVTNKIQNIEEYRI